MQKTRADSIHWNVKFYNKTIAKDTRQVFYSTRKQPSKPPSFLYMSLAVIRDTRLSEWYGVAFLNTPVFQYT